MTDHPWKLVCKSPQLWMVLLVIWSHFSFNVCSEHCIGSRSIRPAATYSECRELHWRRILRKKKLPHSNTPHSIWWPFQWQKKKERERELATCNHFQRGECCTSQCQHGNASSSWELNLCCGFRWPARWWWWCFQAPQRVREASEVLRQNHLITGQLESKTKQNKKKNHTLP